MISNFPRWSGYFEPLLAKYRTHEVFEIECRKVGHGLQQVLLDFRDIARRCTRCNRAAMKDFLETELAGDVRAETVPKYASLLQCMDWIQANLERSHGTHFERCLCDILSRELVVQSSYKKRRILKRGTRSAVVQAMENLRLASGVVRDLLVEFSCERALFSWQ